MIRRKKPKVLASSYPGLAFPKGQPRAEVKVNRRALETARIKSVRAEVWRRSNHCERCLDIRDRARHELHEAYSRAKTRKMPPSDRFDARWCLRLCKNCHHVVTAGEVQVRFWSCAQGANGSVVWIPSTEAATSVLYTAEDVWRGIVLKNDWAGRSVKTNRPKSAVTGSQPAKTTAPRS